MLSVPQCMLKEKRLCHLHLEDRRKDSYCEVNAGIANMAASGMANASFRGDQRRGPPQSRPGGRPNSFNPSRQVNTINANASMPKRNGAAAHPTTTHPSAQMVAQTTNSACASDGSNLYQDPRYIAGIMHMVGCRVQVDVTNGKSYEGILSTISPDCDLVVKQATLLRRDDAMLPSGEAVKTMVFNRMDYISFRASNLDLKGDSFTDSSIIRANGQSSNPGALKELEPWDGGSDDVTDDPLAVQLDDPDATGWAAEEMFHTNETAFNVPSTYKESLEGYTTPMPTFKTPEEARRAEKLAAEHARSIETQDGYIERLEKENNPSIDEETKFSSVIRPGEAEPSSNSGRYVPPNRRQHLPDQAQRGPAPAPPLASAQQPLPQRERRADRDRGDRGQDGRGDRGWERNPQPRAQHSVPGPYGPPSHGPPSERLNGGDVRERRPEPSGRSGFTARPMNHVGQGIPPQRYPHPHQHIPPQHLVPAHAPPAMPPSAPQVQINRGNPPTSVAAAPVVPVTPNTPSSHPSKKAEARTLSPQATAPQGPAPAPGPDKKSPREKDRQEKQVANLKHFADNFNVKLPEEDKKEERVLQQDRTQQERRADPDHEQSQAPAEESQGVTAVSQGVTAVSQGVTTSPQGTPAAPQGAAATTSQGVTAATPQGATAASAPQGATAASAPQGAAPTVPQGVAATPVSSRGPTAQSPGAAAPAQGASAGSGDQPSVPTSSSVLNPLAMEFKPRQPPQPAMVPVPTPTPSATPPAQPRQSPGMLSHGAPTLVPMQHPYNPNAPYQLMHKMVPMGAGQQPQQQATKPYQQQPKRAVVSVDQAAVVGLAAHTTGQPLQLAAQGAAMQQPSYVYQLPPSQVLQQGGQGYPVQMRMVQSHLPQGAGMEHGQGASNQQTHMPQQFLMAQQPMPAHMPAQALTQTMAQPAHTHHHPQHTHHHPSHMSHQGHPSLPPSTQQQSNPHPSASPVQHLAGPAPTGPQLNHTQGAPPTSGTPQPQLTYGHQIPMLPPQGGAHAMTTHSGAQGHNPALHFNVMQQQQHHQMQQAGVSFSQAGGTASGAPAPAHLQHSSHINQTMNVVVMPQPPPQAINQAPLNPPHPHHAQATAQFQQQLQGAANQLHGGVGPNQHLLQGSVPGGGANMGMAQYPFPMQPGVQGSHNHSHVHQPSHTLAHHTHHYQGQ